MRGRGTTQNPAGRFERLHYQPEAEEEFARNASRAPAEFFADPTRRALSTNQSPDIGFGASLNPYRGCEHGCSYCYARPTHEYLGLSAGLDFESKILVKRRAPELLRRALAARNWEPQVIALSGVTDCYQPAERRFEITRRCLQVLLDFRNPAVIVTKSRLVTRDTDLLRELAGFECISVMISLTTLDPVLQQRMEPLAARPARRLQAMETLAQAGVPVSVMVAPIVPGLTDHEIPAILQAAADAGASAAGRVLLRLPHGVKQIFDGWLQEHYPERRNKVLNRLRAMRGGRLYDSRFGVRQRGEGIFADQIGALFELARRRAGLAAHGPALSTAHFRVPAKSAGAAGAGAAAAGDGQSAAAGQIGLFA